MGWLHGKSIGSAAAVTQPTPVYRVVRRLFFSRGRQEAEGGMACLTEQLWLLAPDDTLIKHVHRGQRKGSTDQCRGREGFQKRCLGSEKLQPSIFKTNPGKISEVRRAIVTALLLVSDVRQSTDTDMGSPAFDPFPGFLIPRCSVPRDSAPGLSSQAAPASEACSAQGTGPFRSWESGVFPVEQRLPLC